MKWKNDIAVKELFLGSVLITVFLWLSCCFLEFLWFNDMDKDFVSILFPLDDPHKMLRLILIVNVILLYSAVISRIYSKLLKSKKKLKQNEYNLQITFNSIGEAIISTDSKGFIKRMNIVAERLTGWSSEESKGLLLSDVFNVNNINLTNCKVNDEYNNLPIRSSMYSKNNIKYKISYSKSLILDDEGKINGEVIVFRDITDQSRMEEMIAQSNKMLSVGCLAVGLAHEINNPLAGLMHTVNVMSNRLTRRNDIPANLHVAEETGISFTKLNNYMKKRGILRMIDAINESGGRIAEIVNDILSFTDKSNSKKSSNNLNIIIDKTLVLALSEYSLNKNYDFKDIHFEKEYSEELPLIICNRSKIQQVILNIIRNGAEAMKVAEVEKPKFIIRTNHHYNNKTVFIEIEDNGPGISDNIRKRIFEPFFTTKPTGEGIGLGLSVSYFIITENHGGEMFVESVPGSGAKFIIKLPLGKVLKK